MVGSPPSLFMEAGTLLNLLILAVGIFLLLKGADYLIDGSVALAKRLGVSELFIGLTIVAFGTSAPELAVSIQAAVKGSGIAIGNVLGSNIANVALVLGASAMIRNIRVSSSTIRSEIPFVVLISLATGMLLLNDSFMISRYEGVVLLCFFIIFIDYVYSMAKDDIVNNKTASESKVENILEKNIALAWLATLGGMAGVVFGGDMVVKSGIVLAKAFGVSETLIGVTIVAIGTSLPELVTSIVAGIKKQADLAVGNIVGSNIFNLLVVLGISSLVSPIKADRPVTQDIIFTIATVAILPFLAGKKKTLGKFSGAILLATYVIYLCMSVIAK